MPKKLFQKGQSGNPGGRPKSDPSAMEWLKEHSKGGQKYYDVLDQIAHGKLVVKRTVVNNAGEFVETEDPPTIKDRIAALTLLTNRIDGTPRQAVELSGPDGGPVTIELIRFGDDEV